MKIKKLMILFLCIKIIQITYPSNSVFPTIQNIKNTLRDTFLGEELPNMHNNIIQPIQDIINNPFEWGSKLFFTPITQEDIDQYNNRFSFINKKTKNGILIPDRDSLALQKLTIFIQKPHILKITIDRFLAGINNKSKSDINIVGNSLFEKIFKNYSMLAGKYMIANHKKEFFVSSLILLASLLLARRLTIGALMTGAGSLWGGKKYIEYKTRNYSFSEKEEFTRTCFYGLKNIYQILQENSQLIPRISKNLLRYEEKEPEITISKNVKPFSPEQFYLRTNNNKPYELSLIMKMKSKITNIPQNTLEKINQILYCIGYVASNPTLLLEELEFIKKDNISERMPTLSIKNNKEMNNLLVNNKDSRNSLQSRIIISTFHEYVHIYLPLIFCVHRLFDDPYEFGQDMYHINKSNQIFKSTLQSEVNLNKE